MFGAVFLLSQYLQVVQGYSPARGRPAHAALDRRADGGRPDRRCAGRSLRTAPAAAWSAWLLQTASLVWFAVVTESAAPYSSFIVPLALAGIGMGLTFAPVSTMVLDGLPDADFAMASSANSTIREFGVALGVALLTAVFLGNGGEISPVGYDGAVGPALLTGAAAVGVALVAALFAPRRTA